MTQLRKSKLSQKGLFFKMYSVEKFQTEYKITRLSYRFSC